MRYDSFLFVVLLSTPKPNKTHSTMTMTTIMTTTLASSSSLVSATAHSYGLIDHPGATAEAYLMTESVSFGGDRADAARTEADPQHRISARGGRNHSNRRTRL